MDPYFFSTNLLPRNTSFLPASPVSENPIPSETTARSPSTFARPFIFRAKSTTNTRPYVSPYPPIADTTQTSRSSPAASSSRPANRVASARRTRSARPRFVEPPISATQKRLLVQALNEHRINTLSELRRIERIFAELGSADLTQPMTGAWSYFVNSHSLLNEIRQRCPSFSSECLTEAKRRVYEDPASNRSWNLCWLVLNKIRNDGLVEEYARMQSSRPEMWGGQPVSSDLVTRLKNKFVQDWTAVLAQLLRYWETPPTSG